MYSIIFHVSFGGLVSSLLDLNVNAASRIKLTVTPSEIIPPLTPDLTLSCGLKDTATVKKHADDVQSVPYGVLRVLSIVVSRGDSDYVAMVTQASPAQAFVDKSSLTVEGNVTGTSGHEAHLELTWAEPTRNQSGSYRCEIHALGPFGQPVELSDDVTVRLGELTVEDVARSLKTQKERYEKTTANMEHLLQKIAQGWTLFKKHWYKTLPGTRSYAEARAACRRESAQIALPKTTEESAFVYDNMAGGKQWMWIGLDDLQSEGTFQWGDGSPLLGSEMQWLSGEPNNINEEDCVALGVTSKLGWNDGNCDVKSPTVCQSDLSEE